MVEEQQTPPYVRVLGANVAMAATFLLFVPLSFALATHFAEPIGNSAAHWAAIVIGGSTGAGLAVLLAIRSARLGIYQRHDSLKIRGVVHTRTVPRGDVVDVVVVKGTGGRGQRYYAPAMLVRRPRRIDVRDLIVLPDDPGFADTRGLALMWLATPTERTAHRRAQAVQELVRFGPSAAGHRSSSSNS